jgi:3-hydroxyacyl-CoA dehydrogenase
MFSACADIRDFNTPKAKAEPTLHTLIRMVEASDKPVIAAIAGGCMGGGLELSLGCHFRVAAPDAAIALPEVKIGVLPGAGDGGCARIGIEPARIYRLRRDPAAQLRASSSTRSSTGPAAGAIAFARKVAEENSRASGCAM